MATAITQEPLHLIDVDAIVVALGGSELSGPAQELNTQTDGALQRMIDGNEASLKVGVTTSWLAPNGIKAPVVMLVGLGSCDSPENISYFKAAGAAAKTLAAKQRNTVAYYFPECDAAALETGVSGSLIGCHGQDICRSKRDLFTPDNILWATSDAATVENGVIIAQGINLTRDLVNGPPNMVYPETFAEQIESLGETTSLEIEVWDAAKLAEEKCGSLLAVAQGSAREARLVIMRYRGSDVADPQLALVGKGVTYDSGGLSLKPSDGQKTMKCDMGGAATVVGTMQAISQLKLPCHVIGLVGLVENMVSSNAYRLGDVITARNGKTIEVLNTDAEGRLVLADVLDIAVGQKPAHMIDLATLTGACCIALGLNVTGFMTNDQAWCDDLTRAAATTGEQVWQLPMFKEFGSELQSKVADLRNIGAGRWGGAITAGKFLEEFVSEVSWTHMDIAGPAFADSPKKWVDGGASGVMVRTLIEVIRQLEK